MEFRLVSVQNSSIHCVLCSVNENNSIFPAVSCRSQHADRHELNIHEKVGR